MTRAVERLSIDWPAEREDIRSKNRLDEVSRSWEKTVSYRVYSTQP